MTVLQTTCLLYVVIVNTLVQFGKVFQLLTYIIKLTVLLALCLVSVCHLHKEGQM